MPARPGLPWDRGGLARSAALLASGTVVAQLVGVLTAPILSRLYDPDALGQFGVFVAVVSVLAVASSGRYEAAIPLPAEDAEAVAILVLAVATSVVTSCVLGAVVILVTSGFGPSLGQHAPLLLWIMPVALLVSGMHQVLTLWATRTEAFAVGARANVGQAVIQAATQIGGGLASPTAIPLAIAYIVGRTSAVVLLLSAVRANARSLIAQTRRIDVRRAAAVHRRFPLFALWSAMLNAAGFQLPVLILAVLFPAGIVGWFLLTVRVLQLPLAVIGTAVGQVFYSRASHATVENLRATTVAVVGSLAILGTGPMVVLASSGGNGFAIVFGEAWRGAGEYAQLLAPWLLLVFVGSPVSTLVYVLDRQRTELLFQLLLLVGRVAAVLLGWQLGSAYLAITLFAATSAVLWGIYLLWLVRLTHAPVVLPLVLIAREVAVALVLALPILVANHLKVDGPAWVAIAMVVTVAMVALSARRLARA